MFGTLVAALEVRQVKLGPDDAVCEVEGDNVLEDGFPVLRAVRVHYRLRIPAGTREAVDRALAKHQDKCPTAHTLANCVAITWSADVTEA